MKTVLHFFRHDLRRMAPWIAVYFAALSLLLLDPISKLPHRPMTFLTTVLFLTALLGALALEHPLYARRPFWRTRPIDRRQLLWTRGLFAVVFVIIPLVVAEVGGLILLGFGHPGLLGLVVLDQFFAYGFLVLALLALATLCRKPYQLPLVFFVFLWAPPFWRLLPFYANHEPRIELYSAILAGLAMFVSAVSLLVGTHSWRLRPVLFALLCWVASVLADPVAIRIAQATERPRMPAPQGIELSIEPSRFFTTSHYGNQRWLVGAVLPTGLTPEQGLEIEGLEATLVTESGEVLNFEPPDLGATCVLPGAVVVEAPELDRYRTTLAGCQARLEILLIEVPYRADSSLAGSLELRFRLRAFRGDFRRVALRPDAGFAFGSEFVRVRNVEVTEVDSPVLAPQGLRIRWIHFSPLGRWTQDRDLMPNDSRRNVRIFDRERGFFFEHSDGSSTATARRFPRLSHYERFRIEDRQFGLRHHREGGLLDPSRSEPDRERAEFQVFVLEKHLSEPFEVVVVIDDFEATEFLEPSQSRLPGHLR